VLVDGVTVLRLSYGDATDLFRINLGWAAQANNQPPGFILDLERGYWAKNQADAEDQDDATATGRLDRVVPYVRDTKNALVMRFDPPRSAAEMAELQAAFRQAILQLFQLEPRELSCEPIPSSRDRQELLFYEAAEGGAGVLRQLVEDPNVIPTLARRALELCHYDIDTLEDRGSHFCGKACYECLLDYGNQPDHKDLDRTLIRDQLATLARSECRPASGTGSRAERVDALRKRCDSKLEQRWLDLIDKHMLRLADEAQFIVPQMFAQADFFYRNCNAAIFVDGPPHDEADIMLKDQAINKRLMEAGYIVIRFHHKDDWLSIVQKHPDVFGVIAP
jgi:very-short-patch-repair endonuclease